MHPRIKHRNVSSETDKFLPRLTWTLIQHTLYRNDKNEVERVLPFHYFFLAIHIPTEEPTKRNKKEMKVRMEIATSVV